MSTPQKIIIDTDPGIDDAIALLFALQHPGLDVLAITSVAGNIGLARTTENAGRIAALLGQALPVHPGADRPLKSAAIDEARIHGDDGLGGVAFPAPLQSASDQSAQEAFLDLLNAHPDHSIDLLMLGPQTNLARLIQEHPDAGKRFRRIIAMGGAIDEPGNVGPRAEFNIKWDSDAAKLVFEAGLDLTLIPLDTTRKFRADQAYLDALHSSGATGAIAAADLIQAYFETTAEQAKAKGQPLSSRPLHDPCVPLLALRPDIFDLQTRELTVDVETGAILEGDGQVKVSMGLDADAARAFLLEGLSWKPT